jgi:4-amino-4-deoxy-L-arabinose transferase-like glycosyltransferase
MDLSKVENTDRQGAGLYVLAFLAFAFVRLFAWKQTTLLEDHDSVSYLESIETFLTFDFVRIFHLSPDTTPLYPLFGALFSLPGWPVEVGARLCSLLFSAGVVFALIGIGQRLAGSTATGIGLLILAFNPSLIPLSFSVLTEPIFVGIVYLGLWIFWRQYESPTIMQGICLGLIFGASFLARTEGILFLAAIPFLQGVHFLFFHKSKYNFQRLALWTLAFVATFAVLSLPQVWRVSDLMGRFAINGRQAWQLIFNNPDGKSYEEKIYGLNYSPKQINLEYIQSHPETLAQLESSISVPQLAKTIVRNFDDLYQEQLGVLIGPLGLIFFGFGILALLEQRRYYEIFLSLAFISLTLVAPLVHDVDMRHIIVIAPLMMLIEGIGIIYLSRQVVSVVPQKTTARLLNKTLPVLLIALLILCQAHLLFQTFRPPQSNFDYSPAAFEEPLRLVAKATPSDASHQIRIVVRKGYFTYMAGAERFFLPFTDYRGLVTYCKLNDIDFLFLQDQLVQSYPFFEHFKNDPHEFVRLYAGVDEFGNQIRLYRFNKAAAEFEEKAKQEDQSG